MTKTNAGDDGVIPPATGVADGGASGAEAWATAEGGARLAERVKNILTKPGAEWARIDAEPEGVAAVFVRYVMPLAAIPAVAAMIGSLLFGISVLGMTYRPGFGAAIGSAVLQYGLTLAGVFIFAWVVNFLAPKFGGTANWGKAFKTVAYSATAAWVVGIFNLIPALAFVTILGLYSLYLLYSGLPVLMKVPREKALAFTAVLVAAMVAVGLVLGALGSIVRPVHDTSIPTDAGLGGLIEMLEDQEGTAGAGVVAQIEGAANEDQAEAVLQNPVASTSGAMSAEGLAGLLPKTLAGLPLAEIEHASLGAGLGSSAEASYGSGDVTARLDLVDVAPMGGISAVTASLNVQRNRQTATGYERLGKVNGRMTGEKWDSATQRSEYNVLVADRVMVSAEGRGVHIDDLKNAVENLDLDAIEAAIERQ
ncbi:Yip1 family protein [Pelagerythrobacter marensis]|uniref:Yip1 domain-containing protein n=1 Tax=Pelagerythrobacter marensis TaxID=543877 RepID=A0A0G3X6I7_9SPHN|nr:Yip1 family protein [Pelagerythrobacter marensis]AKM06802.1 hypothetical protein AM2010_719 [Pelagerythrobacter marensis]